MSRSRTESAPVRGPAATGPPPWVRDASVALGIVAATLLAYIPAMKSGYIWDDDSYVHNNILVQRGWDALPKIWSPAPLSTPQYYPLVFTTFWAEHKLWGLKPHGYHIVNILLHAANALLVWRLARRLGVPAAAVVGAFFALHPVHVESVAWITERKNVLSGLFYLLALGAYLRFDATGRWPGYAACVLLFVAALLSKSVTASLPAVLALILFFQRRLTWRTAAALGPLFVIGIVSGLWTAALEREHVGAIGPEWQHGLWIRGAVIAPTSFLFYATKLLWPHPLIFIYPRFDISGGHWTAYLPLVTVLALFAGALLAVRRFGRGPILLLCFSAGTLFPALGFLNVYPHRFSFVADHFNYLGSLGFIILYVALGAYVLGRLGRPQRLPGAVRIAAAAAPLLACGVLAHRQCSEYRNVLVLWERTLEKNPHAWIAMVNLGEQYRLRGRLEEARRLYERATHYPIARSAALGSLGLIESTLGNHEAAVRALRDAEAALPPDHPELWFVVSRLGWVLKEAGQLDESLAVLQRAVALAPERVDPHYFLADLYLARGELEPAAESAGRAADLNEYDANCAVMAGNILLALDRYGDARRRFQAALTAAPDHIPAYTGAASAALHSGDCGAALAFLDRARHYAPEDASLWYHRIWVLAACPDARFRDGAAAVELAQRLTERAGVNADTRDALAAAYAEVGDFERAVYFAGDALNAARQGTDARLIAQIEGRLALYRARQPYRAGSK